MTDEEYQAAEAQAEETTEALIKGAEAAGQMGATYQPCCDKMRKQVTIDENNVVWLSCAECEHVFTFMSRRTYDNINALAKLPEPTGGRDAVQKR
jgi:hypothetical protein